MHRKLILLTALALLCTLVTGCPKPDGSAKTGPGEGDGCLLKGKITYNSNAVSNEMITCHHGASPVQDQTDAGGNYQCGVTVSTADLVLEARGDTAPECPDKCSQNGQVITCNANVSGGCSNQNVTVTNSSALPIPLVLAWLAALSSRRRARRA